MQNIDSWKPSKYEYHNNTWKASRNVKQVSIGSRLVSDISADWYARTIPKYVKGSLLDLGCGQVPFFGMYKNYIYNNVCVDWSGSPHSNIHLDIEHDLLKPLPFENNTFDTVILSDVLEHIAEPFFLFNAA